MLSTEFWFEEYLGSTQTLLVISTRVENVSQVHWETDPYFVQEDYIFICEYWLNVVFASSVSQQMLRCMKDTFHLLDESTFFEVVKDGNIVLSW